MTRMFVGFLLGAMVALAGLPDAVQAEGHEGPEQHLLDHMDVSPPLRDLKPLAVHFPRDKVNRAKLMSHDYRSRTPNPRDLSRLTGAAGPLLANPAGPNFDGIGVPSYSIPAFAYAPNPNGSVGATQYVQSVEFAFAVFDKPTGALTYGPAAGNTLWTGFGAPCETDNSSDLAFLYDKAANRWVAMKGAFSSSTHLFSLCIAVSTTSDATGTYRRFSFLESIDPVNPSLGVWPDAYYTAWAGGGMTLPASVVCAHDRNQMLTPSGTPGASQCFLTTTPPFSAPAFHGGLPADLDGSTPPPTTSPNYLLALDLSPPGGLVLFKFHVDWATPTNSTFTGPTAITTSPFTPECSDVLPCIPQPGTTQQLFSPGDLRPRLAYRNFSGHESLVVNHSVQPGIRWYEIRDPGGTPTIFQQGNFSPDATSRWTGSLAMDQAGNMLLGYSASSATLYPSIFVTGRLASDAPGQMQAETAMQLGAGSETAGNWSYRSAMSIDPVDDCTFFYTNEYLKTSGTHNWSTSIGSFRFPGCGGAFFTLTPCRVADTRNPLGPSGGPPLAAGTSRSFPAAGICGVPLDAKAIAINVTVVNETDSGDLRLYATGVVVPLTSTINFAANRVRANNAVVALGTGGQVSVQCDMPGGTTDFLFDVTGYFK